MKNLLKAIASLVITLGIVMVINIICNNMNIHFDSTLSTVTTALFAIALYHCFTKIGSKAE